MRVVLFAFAWVAFAVPFQPQPAAAIKKVPYPEVKIEAPAAIQADAELEAMRKKLGDIVHHKDAKELFALVAPDFFWTANGDPADQFDNKAGALQNFKVAFGFRSFGKEGDNNSAQAFWILLEDAGSGSSLSPSNSHPGALCSPALAKLVDRHALDEASEKFANGDDEDIEWLYALKEITLTEKPGGGGAVAKVSGVAMPVVSRDPAVKSGQNGTVRFYELLLPDGKSGWASADDVDSLAVDRVCFEKDKDGAWKIAGYEQNG